jgi:hypothetical protein
MKISVNLPNDVVEFSRRAVRLRLGSELGSAYEDEWSTWAASGEAGVWEAPAADGLS